jgi:hypothetical protein
MSWRLPDSYGGSAQMRRGVLSGLALDDTALYIFCEQGYEVPGQVSSWYVHKLEEIARRIMDASQEGRLTT